MDTVANLPLPWGFSNTGLSVRTALALGLTLLLSASAFRPPASELFLQLLRPGGSELTYEQGRHGERLLEIGRAHV